MSIPIDINETFVHFVRKCIQPELKFKGWIGSCPTFYLSRDSNWGIINFQKSVSNTREEIKFTVNLGVVCGRIRRFLEPGRADIRPTVWDSNWWQRLPGLVAESQDKWWSINETTKVTDLCKEILPMILNIAVPQVEKLLTDEALRDLWLTGNGGGTKFQRLERLSILLKAIGPNELLQETLDQLIVESRRFGSGGASLYHVKMLDQYSE
jgi:hypothetical protein